MDRDRIEQGARLILEGIGEGPARAGLVGAPRRVADMYADIFSGIGGPDPAELLVAMAGDHHREMAIIRDTDFYSVCGRHLPPFAGMAHVALSMRGVRTPGTRTVTSAARGLIQSHDATRAAAFSLISSPR
ncbi:MAG: GTP cyclohydrolase I [Actinomycetes bacterium]